MKNVIVNRKNLVVVLVVVLISVGAQGISYAQDADEYPPTSSWGGVRAVIPSGQGVIVYTVANGGTASVIQFATPDGSGGRIQQAPGLMFLIQIFSKR